MKTETESQPIPETLKALFDEIAFRLWNHRAAVMIGAGFSRNAAPTFPLWNELGDAFFEKVNGKKPGPGDKAYQSIPRLAQQVECRFGRPALDRILQEQIPDESVNPSALHRRLLDLPWQDVFTTNYDTLLERAASQSRRHYTPVFDAQSLANAEKPRIVKLHGSFPAHRPFVVTEEDYRQYPENRAPFVNTVQQSLLENTLCLIGFSGDDPNFLQWIGWIRDRLGSQYTQRIYLIDCFGMDQPYRNMLAERRIEVVDLSLLPGIERDCRAEALTRFVDYLLSQNPENTKWPGPPALLELHGKNANDAVRYLCPLLESIRTNCPCGFLLPREERESLWFRLMQIPDPLFLNATDDDAIALRLLHEVVWMFSSCLVPLESEMAVACEAVRKRYWPFDSPAPQETVYQKGTHTFSVPWDDLRERWLTLSLELLRYYREHGEKEAASRVLKELLSLREYWTPVQEQWFWYENYLFSLSIFSVESARKSLSLWPENESLPYWAAKKAAAYAELGDLDQAKPRILEAVSCIRSQLNRATGPVIIELRLAENYAIQLRKFIFSAAASKERQFWKKKDSNEQLPNEGKTDSSPLELERNEDRPPKGCYAEEAEMFRLLLDHDLRSKPEPTSRYGFDVGNVFYRSSWSVTKLNEYSAQSMVRFLEVTGFPYKICDSVVLESGAFNNDLQKVSETNVFSGVLLSVREGSTSLPEQVFDRKCLAGISTERANALIETYAQTLEQTLSALSGRIRSEYDPFDLRFLSALPEFLSRLCCKSSFESRTTIWRFVKNAYASPFRSRISHMPELVRRLLHAQSIQETLDRLPFLLTIPQPTEWTPLDEMHYQNPLRSFSLPIDSIKEKPPTIPSSEIVRLFEALSDASGPARKWTIRSLFVLWRIGALSKRQSKSFLDSVLGSSDKTSDDSGLLAFERMQLRDRTSFDDTDKSELMGKLDRLATDSSKTSHDVLRTIQFVYCDFANYEAMYKSPWTQDDGKVFLTRSLQDIWPKIEQGLKSEKTDLPFFDVVNDSRIVSRIFANLVARIGIARIPSGDVSEWKERLEAVFRTCDSFAIPCLELRVAWYVVSGFDEHTTETMIREALLSNQPEKIESALSAMSILFKQDRRTIGDCDLMELLRESILWCSGEAVHAVLHSLWSLFSRVGDAATTPIVSALDNRFRRLLVETDYRDGIPEIPTELKIIIRQDVTHLCIWLALQTPNVTKTRLTCLSQWAALRNDGNEFAEIRVLWKNHPEVGGPAVGRKEPTKNHAKKA